MYIIVIPYFFCDPSLLPSNPSSLACGREEEEGKGKHLSNKNGKTTTTILFLVRSLIIWCCFLPYSGFGFECVCCTICRRVDFTSEMRFFFFPIYCWSGQLLVDMYTGCLYAFLFPICRLIHCFMSVYWEIEFIFKLTLPVFY